jgi:hypothetical protein
MLVLPFWTAVKPAAVPTLNSIESAAVIDSVNPSNLTVAAGAAGRRGNTTIAGSDAGAPLVALTRILSVTSLEADIRLVMLNGLALIAVHEVPLVLNSISVETLVTVSPIKFRAMLGGIDATVAAAGTAMLIALDDGKVAVALVRTLTVLAALPNALLGMFVPVTDAQVTPSLRLNSIAVETPVIMSVEPLYTAFGATLRAGTVTARVADANVVSVALTRT